MKYLKKSILFTFYWKWSVDFFNNTFSVYLLKKDWEKITKNRLNYFLIQKYLMSCEFNSCMYYFNNVCRCRDRLGQNYKRAHIINWHIASNTMQWKMQSTARSHRCPSRRNVSEFNTTYNTIIYNRLSVLLIF